MEPIEEYFNSEYILEKKRIHEIEDLIPDVSRTLYLNHKKGIPYEIEKNSKEYDEDSSEKISLSTNSMVLCVLEKLRGKLRPKSILSPYIEWDRRSDEKCEIDTCCTNIYNLIKENNFNSDRLEICSSSYGKNDPFTLSWLAELLINVNPNYFEESLRTQFLDIARTRIIASFENPTKPILEFDEGRRASSHVFPLLKIIHLYKAIEDTGSLKENNLSTNLIRADLLNRVNQQISYSITQPNSFDTAELVLSVEGLILLEEPQIQNNKLLDTIFTILEENQKHNLYWRPLKPFITWSQGSILLPLSIEIANSLLRICKLMEKKRKYYFHQYHNIFDNYTQWLLANISQVELNNKRYKGWCSEHVQSIEGIIHPWETAQVILFLMNYKSMIQDRIAYESLKRSGLSYKDFASLKITLTSDKMNEDLEEQKQKIWNEKWELYEKDGNSRWIQQIMDKFISPRINSNSSEKMFSMLLYGPPGTGKSTIAKSLAESLNWRMITITPSDFIKHGESDIENRAKNIFKTLEEQKDCVILFDEIDRLILDRDSQFYSNQGDIYQFMTPSMLVKINDLRTKERCIFIIATNYEERIDSAIKRQGRIDQKYLINPPDKEERKKIITQIIHKNQEIDKKELQSWSKLDNLAERTCFYTYSELKNLAKNIDYRKENLPEVESPTIKLSTYQRRFQMYESDNSLRTCSSIFPYNEFYSLIKLKLECNSMELAPEEIALFQKVVKIDNDMPDKNDLIEKEGINKEKFMKIFKD